MNNNKFRENSLIDDSMDNISMQALTTDSHFVLNEKVFILISILKLCLKKNYSLQKKFCILQINKFSINTIEKMARTLSGKKLNLKNSRLKVKEAFYAAFETHINLLKTRGFKQANFGKILFENDVNIKLLPPILTDFITKLEVTHKEPSSLPMIHHSLLCILIIYELQWTIENWAKELKQLEAVNKK